MSGKHDADTLAQMRRLWDERPELSAAKIGERFGITGDAVKGLALRRGWAPRGTPRERAEPRTTFAQRIDAMHARMDEMLAATRPLPLDEP